MSVWSSFSFPGAVSDGGSLSIWISHRRPWLFKNVGILWTPMNFFLWVALALWWRLGGNKADSGVIENTRVLAFLSQDCIGFLLLL
jgi:hypothetical protein